MTKNQLFIERIKELRDAFVAAELEVEDELINSDTSLKAYPFPNSFDEMAGNVEAWITALEIAVSSELPIEFTYTVDLDERGEFRAHLDDENGLTLISYETDDIRELIDDGFMKHGRDAEGLREHLSDCDVIKPNVTIKVQG